VGAVVAADLVLAEAFDDVADVAAPPGGSGIAVEERFAGMGNDSIEPSGKMGLGQPPASLSKPFRLVSAACAAYLQFPAVVFDPPPRPAMDTGRQGLEPLHERSLLGAGLQDAVESGGSLKGKAIGYLDRVRPVVGEAPRDQDAPPAEVAFLSLGVLAIVLVIVVVARTLPEGAGPGGLVTVVSVPRLARCSLVSPRAFAFEARVLPVLVKR
jgi:hypothetical protein